MSIKEVIDALERFAPLPLQESYDNAGLQVGLTEAEVSGALLCLDVTEQVIDEAAARGCNLVVSHHPLLFRGLKCISDSHYVQRTVVRAIQRGVTVVAMHTNMDNAPGGVSHIMARRLLLADIHFVSTAAQAAGHGCGVTGTLPQPLSAEAFLATVKRTFAARCVMSNAPLGRPVSRVALCGGAGAFVLDEAISAGADAFVTGEMSYHDYFGHDGQIQIAVIGHYESEQYTTELFQSIIREACPGVRTVMARTVTNPINYM